MEDIPSFMKGNLNNLVKAEAGNDQIYSITLKNYWET